jgi:SAM-dependent methyltransferase
MVRVRERLRETFGTVAELYDRARPTYPAVLFEDLTTLSEGRRLLEIGCGTGQATRDLVAHGFDVTCVDLSADMVEVARRNVPQATFVVADVETWDGRGFDVVASFTAFHWLDARFETAARLLRGGGLLAVVETHHVLGADAFFAEAQEDYDAVVPHPDNRPPPPPEEIPDLEVDTERFEPAVTRRYPVEIEYTPDEYIAVLGTYSNNIALPAVQRNELFRRLHARAAAQGTLRKLYLFTLTAARKRQGATSS